MPLKDFLTNLFDDRIRYDELSLIDENMPFAEQIYSFKEDLLQVDSKDGQCLLDVGWHPEFKPKGFFKVVIIKKYDWEKPLFETRVSDIKSLKVILQECKLRYNF